MPEVTPSTISDRTSEVTTDADDPAAANAALYDVTGEANPSKIVPA